MTVAHALSEPGAGTGVPAARLWRVDLEQAPDRLAGLAATLSAPERARAARYRRPRDRDRFVASRGALRAILGGLLAVPPAAVPLAVTPLEKV